MDIRTEILLQYRLDFSKGFYVRELGKLINVSHVTLLPHLLKLETDGILVSKMVGKNKEYRLNHKNFLVKDLLCATEKYFIHSFFEANKKFHSLYEAISNLRIINPIICNDAVSEIFVIGSVSNELKENLNNLSKKNSVKIIFYDDSDFYQKFLTHDLSVKKILKSRIVLLNSDFIINLLWQNYAQLKRGEDVE